MSKIVLNPQVDLKLGSDFSALSGKNNTTNNAAGITDKNHLNAMRDGQVLKSNNLKVSQADLQTNIGVGSKVRKSAASDISSNYVSESFSKSVPANWDTYDYYTDSDINNRSARADKVIFIFALFMLVSSILAFVYFLLRYWGIRLF